MKYKSYILAIVLLIITACSHTEDFHETLLCFRGEVLYDDYWWSVFDADSGVSIKVDFESDRNLDLLLVDSEGFTQFERRIGYEVITHKDWYIGMEEFRTCTLTVQKLDSLYFSVYIPYLDSLLNPVDVFLFNTTQYDQYLQGQATIGYRNFYYTTWVAFNFSPNLIETLFLVVDNTSLHGTNPEGPDVYWADVCHYKADTIDYFVEGTRLDVQSADYCFDIQKTEQYFFIANNAGYIQGGATPLYDADIYIDLQTTGQ